MMEGYEDIAMKSVSLLPPSFLSINIKAALRFLHDEVYLPA